MAFGGTFIAVGLVAALLALSAPAAADTLVPALPSLPAPPVTLGRCIAAGEEYLNGGGRTVAVLRDVGFAASEHQRAAAIASFAGVSHAATPEGDVLVTTMEAAIAASGAAIGPLQPLPSLLASSLGPGVNLTVTGAGQAAVALLPLAPDEAAVLVPWVGVRYGEAVEPLVAWNDRTTYSMLLQLEQQKSFFAGYLGDQVNGLEPPMGPAEASLAGASRGLDSIQTGIGPFVAGVVAASEGAGRAAEAAGGAVLPLAGGVGGHVGRSAAAVQAGANTVAGWAQADAGTMAAALQAGANGAAARTQAFPAHVAGCPGSS